MIHIIALLCATSLLPQDCTTDSALDVLTFPSVANELQCARDAMQTLAGLAIEAGPDSYWKVECHHG